MKNRVVKTAALFIVAVSINAFCPQEAFVSKVHYENVSLEELTRMTPYIFIVKRVKPYTTVQKIPIHPDRGKYPDFTQVTLHYELVETLRGHKAFAPGRKISVLPAHNDEEFSHHKEYYLDNLSVSPIYRRYNSGVDPDAVETLIVFVRQHDDGRFEFAALGSYESVARKDAIMALVRKWRGNRR